MDQEKVTEEKLAKAFNDWMFQYQANPEQFEAEFNSIGEFRNDLRDGQTPTYGDKCAKYLLSLIEL